MFNNTPILRRASHIPTDMAKSSKSKPIEDPVSEEVQRLSNENDDLKKKIKELKEIKRLVSEHEDMVCRYHDLMNKNKLREKAMDNDKQALEDMAPTRVLFNEAAGAAAEALKKIEEAGVADV